MRSLAARLALVLLLLLVVSACQRASEPKGWIVLSQHRGADGNLWWRNETPPVDEDACLSALKRVTGRPAVGVTKWYDVTTDQLARIFGTVATPTKGSWVACWSANVWRKNNVIWAEPDR